MVAAMILAGGVGARLGKGIPKQFIKVQGTPILVHTVEKFQDNPNIDVVEIVCHENYIDYCHELVMQYSLTKVKWIVNGGSSFPESTVKGLNFLSDKLCPEDIVMIHGSSSPMVTDDVINDGINVCRKYKSAMAVQNLHLSTCIKDNEFSSTKPIDKDSIVQVQFPLTFQYKYICDAYDKVIKEGSFDKLGLHLQYAIFSNGGTMYFSKGDDHNIKITTQAELDFFEGYLLLKEKYRKENI